MNRRFEASLVLFLLLLLTAPAAAQSPGGGRGEAPHLKAPSDFLGYTLGDRFTPHDRVVAYVRHVVEASPRAQLTRYGTTPEGRPLLLVTLSAPENLAHLEEIRTAHLRRTGLGTSRRVEKKGRDRRAARLMSAGAPGEKAVVWLSYNVHGDEASSTEAAMKTLYTLANPQNARTGRALQDAVVLLDPCLNPDGRERYVQWYHDTRGLQPNARPEAREHDPPWPSGRGNHYLFDLNRDWAWGTQPETRARLRQYHRWMPHVHVDFHEMGVNDPYYFAPGAEPRHEVLTPFQKEFQHTVGRANAAAFDRKGWLYFTGEVYDLFYPGYGDTWPLFNGAIGMTYEQAGGGRAGLLIQTKADSLSLKERIAHHYTASLTTVETAAQERARLVKAFDEYYRTARAGLPGAPASYVVNGQNADRRHALTALLERQHIRYGYAAGGTQARGTRYATGAGESFRVKPGDLVVPSAQPKARLVRVLFERQPVLSDSVTYDITAWGLPYAYGMAAHTVPEGSEVRTRDTPPRVGGATAASSSAASSSAAQEDAAPYAFLASWKSLADARLLGRLLEKGVDVRFARKPFEADGRHWGRGTLIVTRTDNASFGKRFTEVVRGAAQGQPLTPIESGLTASGPDVGSGNVAVLDKPSVAVLAGEGLSSVAVGEVWHFLDRRLQYPATLLSTEDLRRSDLMDYDVLVMPSGDYGDFFSGDGAAALHQWVEAGGRLIALGEAADFLSGHEGFALKHAGEADSDEADSDEADGASNISKEASDASKRRYARREREAASGRVPGAVFRTQLDPTHPLAYGYAAGGPAGGPYYTLKLGASAFAPLPEGAGWNVATLPDSKSKSTPVSGFAGAEAQKELAGALVFGVENIGAGQAVYLVDDPLFRGFWQGGMLLFSNAVFFVGQG